MENTTIEKREKEIELTNAGKLGVEGTHILTTCDMSSNKAQGMEKEIEEWAMIRQLMIEKGKWTKDLARYHWEEYKKKINKLNELFGVSRAFVHNLTTDAGRSVLAARLSGTTTNTGVVNYGALGTSATAPTVANTQLGTETYRKALSSGTFASNVAYLENFYTATDVSGTFQEYGFFIDGTGSANSGVLFNRFTSTVVKTNVQSLNVQSTITINSV